MKDIKTYIIGFLSCACLFLFMGHTSPSLFEEREEEQMRAVFPKQYHEHSSDDVYELLLEVQDDINRKCN